MLEWLKRQVRDRFLQPLAERVAARAAARLESWGEAASGNQPGGAGAAGSGNKNRPIPDAGFVPTPIFDGIDDELYMGTANCRAADFFHSEFARFCDEFKHHRAVHRKLWEWAFVHHHLSQAGVLKPGRRGLVFGVGSERLPALFASYGALITATDAPDGVGELTWRQTGQHSAHLEALHAPEFIDAKTFRERVTYEPVDMNAIGNHLRDYDFCWSSCCFEHLGSIQAGMDFVHESLRTLKVGGVSVQTTELNLSSDVHTVDHEGTVLYRRRDIEALKQSLRDAGHIVKELPIKPGMSYIDGLVDTPPYGDHPHLKVRLGEYVCTSVGIVVQRGR